MGLTQSFDVIMYIMNNKTGILNRGEIHKK